MSAQEENAKPIVIEQTYNTTADKVWLAISDNIKMKQWYFDMEEFKPEIGFEFVFYGGTEEKSYKHICKITDIEQGKKLAHSWCYDGYPGDSIVTWELFAEGDKTKVRLTHEGLETFPDINDFKKENFVAGWTEITGKLLKEFLEK